jgi:hypothetical protein
VFALGLLVVSLSANPPIDLTTQIGKLSHLNQLKPFLDVASKHSNILQPQSLVGESYPLLAIDIFNEDSLAMAGISPDGALQHMKLNVISVGCVTLNDVAKHIQVAGAKLKTLGEMYSKKISGVPVQAARDSLGRVLAAYAISGQHACSIVGHGYSIEKQLPMLAQFTSRPQVPVKPLKNGIVVSQVREGDAVLTLNANQRTSTIDGRFTKLPLAHFETQGLSPFATFAPSGLLSLRTRLAQKDLSTLMLQVIPYFPHAELLQPKIKLVAPLLTGNVAAYVSKVKVTNGLLATDARFYAIHSTVLAETKNPAAAAKVLANLDKQQLQTKFGTLKIWVEGRFIVFSNDDETAKVALEAAKESAGIQKHGFEFVLETPLVAKAMMQVPLMEAVQSAELAGLLAAATELGPLLMASEKMEGYLDFEKLEHVGHVEWSLQKKYFEPKE